MLTIVDYATRDPEAVPLATIETERVSEALLDVFCRVGLPKEVLSDRASQFVSDLKCLDLSASDNCTLLLTTLSAMVFVGK